MVGIGGLGTTEAGGGGDLTVAGGGLAPAELGGGGDLAVGGGELVAAGGGGATAAPVQSALVGSVPQFTMRPLVDTLSCTRRPVSGFTHEV